MPLTGIMSPEFPRIRQNSRFGSRARSEKIGSVTQYSPLILIRNEA
jgi:hypothetical protein